MGLGRSKVLILMVALEVFLQLIQGGTAEEEHYYNGTRMLRGRKQVSGCNLFQGKWVFDPSYPLYDSAICPFIDPEFDCIKYGRPDKQFLKYSWRPDSCAIPRFNGLDFLRRWRGKRIMFVGDSLSLNMFESLGCMIHASVPNTKTSFARKGSLSIITFQKFKAAAIGACLGVLRLIKETSLYHEVVGWSGVQLPLFLWSPVFDLLDCHGRPPLVKGTDRVGPAFKPLW